MKRLLITSLICALLPVFGAQAEVNTWHVANQSTIAWDAVTTNTGGGIVSPEQISYVLYITDSDDDPLHLNPLEMGPTDELTYLVTLTVESDYHVGVQSVRTVNGNVVGESRIVWSNEEPYNFGLRYYLPPADPVWKVGQ